VTDPEQAPIGGEWPDPVAFVMQDPDRRRRLVRWLARYVRGELARREAAERARGEAAGP
jgi:hypothetical protein